MNRLALACVVFVLQFAFAQTTPAPQHSGKPAAPKSPFIAYEGTWTGNFEGTPWLVVKLALAGESLTGSVQHAHDIQLDDSGELKSVSGDPSTNVVQNAKATPDGVVLICTQSDEQEPIRFLMRLTGEGTADIRPVGITMPPGMPKPKPWKLVKQATAR